MQQAAPLWAAPAAPQLRVLPSETERPVAPQRAPLKSQPGKPVPRLLRLAAERAFFPERLLRPGEMDRAVVWGDDMPRAYQLLWTDGSVTFQSAAWNPSNDDPAGHPNLEFPWHTGGTDHSTNARSFKVVVLPYKAGPVAVKRQARNDGSYWTATLPEGTKAFEVLTLNDGQYDHTFEVRQLMKCESSGDVESDWVVKVFRPIKDRAHLLSLCGDAYAAKLTDPQLHTISDSHDTPVFRAEGLVDSLPDMPAPLVRKLLSQPFRDVTDHPWVETSNGKAFAPTTAGLGIVSNHYQGGYFHSANCLTCHATVQRPAANFSEARHWYGRVRGSDGIFSLPLADPDSIGGPGERRDFRVNQEMVNLGVFAKE